MYCIAMVFWVVVLVNLVFVSFPRKKEKKKRLEKKKKRLPPPVTRTRMIQKMKKKVQKKKISPMLALMTKPRKESNKRA